MSRRAWLLVGAAYVIGAIGLLIAIGLVERQANNVEHKEAAIEALTVNITAAICLQAFASEPAERLLVPDLVTGHPMPLDNEACQRAVVLARQLIDADD
jgi:hypothetical protein